MTPTRFWSVFGEIDFVENSFSNIASGNFGEVKKAKFKNKEILKQSYPHRNHWYGEQFTALKYPLGENHDTVKQFNSLSHEVSCTLILHPNLGKIIIIIFILILLFKIMNIIYFYFTLNF